MAGRRTLDVRVLAADPRSLDVRSTSRWTSLVRRRARRPIWPKRRRVGLRYLMNDLAGPVVARRRMPVGPPAQQESRNRSQGCHRRRLEASTPTWSLSTAWTLRVDVGDSMQRMTESGRADGGAPTRNPPPRTRSKSQRTACSRRPSVGSGGWTWLSRRASRAGRSSTSNMRMQLQGRGSGGRPPNAGRPRPCS